jgi:hypothetical protein
MTALSRCTSHGIARRIATESTHAHRTPPQAAWSSASCAHGERCHRAGAPQQNAQRRALVQVGGRQGPGRCDAPHGCGILRANRVRPAAAQTWRVAALSAQRRLRHPATHRIICATLCGAGGVCHCCDCPAQGTGVHLLHLGLFRPISSNPRGTAFIACKHPCSYSPCSYSPCAQSLCTCARLSQSHAGALAPAVLQLRIAHYALTLHAQMCSTAAPEGSSLRRWTAPARARRGRATRDTTCARARTTSGCCHSSTRHAWTSLRRRCSISCTLRCRSRSFCGRRTRSGPATMAVSCALPSRCMRPASCAASLMHVRGARAGVPRPLALPVSCMCAVCRGAAALHARAACAARRASGTA